MKQFDIPVGAGHFADKAAVPFIGHAGFTAVLLQAFAVRPLNEHIYHKKSQLEQKHRNGDDGETDQQADQPEGFRERSQEFIDPVNDIGGIIQQAP